MSYTQDKAHSSALVGAIIDGEKAQQQQSTPTNSDSASIFSTSSFSSTKALLKKPFQRSSSPTGKKSSDNKSTEAELLRNAERNSVKMNF